MIIKPEYDIDLPHFSSGKVRDIYEINSNYLLFVTTDRISAFDVVLPNRIHHKGEILTKLSKFWFDLTKNIIPNHSSNIKIHQLHQNPKKYDQIKNRCMIVKRLAPLPIEAIVRGYITGSGWKDYQKTGNICNIPLPEGLQLSEKLPEPIYTPSTKADIGDHDMNISFEETVKLVGIDLAEQVKKVSLELYSYAHEYALSRGIIIADTKLEFGLDDEGVLHLIDEVLTPDSSRFWPEDSYVCGENPPSYDKQFIRDYLETVEWDKKEPGPELPSHIVDTTTKLYTNLLKTMCEL